MIEFALGKRILALRERVAAEFTTGDWHEVGLLTGYSDIISNHKRLLRSLSFGDEDYAGNALEIIKRIAERDEDAFKIFEQFVADKYPGEGQYISAKPSKRKITFAPNVFQLPDSLLIEHDLVALMMPFRAEFDPVHAAIRHACSRASYRCLRVDDIWEESAVMRTPAPRAVLHKAWMPRGWRPNAQSIDGSLDWSQGRRRGGSHSRQGTAALERRR